MASIDKSSGDCSPSLEKKDKLVATGRMSKYQFIVTILALLLAMLLVGIRLPFLQKQITVEILD